MEETNTRDDREWAPPAVRLLLTPDEAASALGIKRTFLYQLLKTRQLFSVKVGASRRIPTRALMAYVDRLCDQEEVS